jgi:hypothetical protein
MYQTWCPSGEPSRSPPTAHSSPYKNQHLATLHTHDAPSPGQQRNKLLDLQASPRRRQPLGMSGAAASRPRVPPFPEGKDASRTRSTTTNVHTHLATSTIHRRHTRERAQRQLPSKTTRRHRTRVCDLPTDRPAAPRRRPRFVRPVGHDAALRTR